MMEILNGIATYVLPFLFVLTILIFFHELGHYLIARKAGVKVEVFSIGFGRELLGWTARSGTRWKVCLLPFGGYVKMFGAYKNIDKKSDAKPFTPEEKKVAFDYKPLGQRAAIAAAGPFANFVLAAILFVLIALVYGERVMPPLIAQPAAQTIADEIGLQRADKILTINGQSVKSFDQIFERLQKANTSEPLKWELDRSGRILTIESPVSALQSLDWKDPAKSLAILGISPFSPAQVGEMVPKSPASKAGLMKGDKIIRIGSHSIIDFAEIPLALRGQAGKELEFEVLRGGNAIILLITPELAATPDPNLAIPSDQAFIGIKAQLPSESIRLNPISSLWQGISQTVRYTSMTFDAIGQLITGQRSTDELGGPIRIAQISGQVAKMGFENLLKFMALLSINLAIINLFPIPGLDGGHLMIFGIEKIRGRPLNERLKTAFLIVGFSLVIGLLLFTTILDILRIRGIPN